MFMDNKQLKNAIELYKIRKRESRLSIFILMAIPTFLFVLDFFGVITQVLNYNARPVGLQLNTYSKTALFPLALFIGFLALNYKSFNQEHQVLPQTNKSRFFSYALYNYSLFLKVSMISIGLYLLQYGIISIMAKFSGNIHLAYDFSWSFVIWGLLVNLIYGFLAISLLIFIGVLDRKFGLIFKIIFGLSVLLLFISINGNLVGRYIVKIIGFWTKESSLILFTAKALGLWLAITGISWSLNSRTVYYKSENHRFPKWVVTALGAFVIFTFTSTFLIMGSFTGSSSSHKEISVSTEEYNILQGGYTLIPLDCSSLNTGDLIKIVPDFTPENEDMTIWTNTVDDFEMGSINSEAIEGLHISYKFPKYSLNNVDLNSFTKGKITATLEGTTLYLHYSYDENQKVLLISPYSFMDQFQAFKNKNLFNPALGTYRSNGWGDIRIISESGIKVMPVH